MGQRSELLTARCVPNLQFDLNWLHDALWCDLDYLGRVVGAKCRLCFRELALDISVHDAGLADACIAQHDNFVGFLRC